MIVSLQIQRPKYADVLREIDYIQDKKNEKQDYHAFVYWFIATLYGKDHRVNPKTSRRHQRS